MRRCAESKGVNKSVIAESAPACVKVAPAMVTSSGSRQRTDGCVRCSTGSDTKNSYIVPVHARRNDVCGRKCFINGKAVLRTPAGFDIVGNEVELTEPNFGTRLIRTHWQHCAAVILAVPADRIEAIRDIARQANVARVAKDAVLVDIDADRIGGVINWGGELEKTRILNTGRRTR